MDFEGMFRRMLRFDQGTFLQTSCDRLRQDDDAPPAWRDAFRSSTTGSFGAASHMRAALVVRGQGRCVSPAARCSSPGSKCRPEEWGFAVLPVSFTDPDGCRCDRSRSMWRKQRRGLASFHSRAVARAAWSSSFQDSAPISVNQWPARQPASALIKRLLRGLRKSGAPNIAQSFGMPWFRCLVPMHLFRHSAVVAMSRAPASDCSLNRSTFRHIDCLIGADGGTSGESNAASAGPLRLIVLYRAQQIHAGSLAPVHIASPAKRSATGRSCRPTASAARRMARVLPEFSRAVSSPPQTAAATLPRFMPEPTPRPVRLQFAAVSRAELRFHFLRASRSHRSRLKISPRAGCAYRTYQYHATGVSGSTLTAWQWARTASSAG